MSADAPVGDAGVEYLLRGIDDPRRYYYRGAFMDLLRGIEYLLTRDDVDPTRLGMMGTSQGGGLVLCAAALEPHVRAVVAHVPFFCDLAQNPILQAKGIDAGTFAYFDPVSHAPRLRAATLLSSGGRDTLCPPETIRAVFDRLPGVKALYHDPELIHTSSGDFYQQSWAWMARYLR